jgi:hypothetical protein
VALWVSPNVEFFGFDDVMPSNLNDLKVRYHSLGRAGAAL